VLAKVSELALMHASSTMPRGVGDTKLTSLFAASADPRNWSGLATPVGWTTESFHSFLTEFPKYEAWRSKELSWIPYPILGTPIVAVPKAAANGQTICMTGFRDKDLEDAAIQKGHVFVQSLTGKVTLLLVADGTVKESEKVKAARAKGTPILSRSEFVAKYLS
jgi:hypothetical protein